MTRDLELPPLTQQPTKFVDMTPDRGLALRILRAYRADCDSWWEVSGLSEDQRRVYDLMNEHQRQRAVILDHAIARLSA